MTEPIGTRNLAEYQLVDMFTACTTASVKDAILQSFCHSTGSNLHVIIATVALGMGLDCPNVRRVVHWGPSHDLEQYTQETGRAGRDNKPSTALLYLLDKKYSQVDQSMKDYFRNTDKCRRMMLLEHFQDTQTTHMVPIHTSI